MQVNQTQTLSFLMSLPTGFVIDDGSVVLTLQRPDGVQMGQIPGSVSPNTFQSNQTLSAVYTPTMGGLWKSIWFCTIDGIQYSYPVNFWVVWTDIYDAVRSMLGASTANIADSILDREFRNLDTTLRNYAPTLPVYYVFDTVYNTVNLAYSDGYDQGIAKLLAARIRKYVGGKRPTGEISLFKKGTTTVQYTEGQPKQEFTIEQEWEMQGMALLEANIPEIFAAAVSDRTGDEIMTRGQLAWGNRHSSIGQIDTSCVGNVPSWYANNRHLNDGGDFE